MTTAIVMAMFPITDAHRYDRKHIERISENQDDMESLFEEIKRECQVDDAFDVKVWEISDFVTECNDEEVNLDNYWLAHFVIADYKR